MICSLSKQKINQFMTFGKMPISNGFIDKKDFSNEFFFEMKVGFSEKISLFQLMEHPKPEMMFNNNYPFFTSSSKFMVNHFKNYADWIKKEYINNTNNLIEIGSNDGTFLKNFLNNEISVFGFEPSSNVSRIAIKNGINSLNEFFNSNNINNYRYLINNTDIICAANVICHIPDLEDLFKTIDNCLNKKGLFIFEEPYLGSMFNKVSYDQIYDEHIYIFSVTSVNNICKLFDLELINVLPQETHGGSMRYVCARKKQYEINKSVIKKLDEERKLNLDNIDSCLNFKKNCEISKKKLIEKIKKIKEQKKTICGYAATSKSTTILNYCGINNKHIDFICDTTPNKINTFSPGTHIPIVAVDYFKKNIPDHTFLFAWNHKREIFKKEKKILNKTKWFAHVNI